MADTRYEIRLHARNIRMRELVHLVEESYPPSPARLPTLTAETQEEG